MADQATPPLIGALFVAAGLITQAELDTCLQIQAERHPDLPLGQILLRYGYVSAPDLARILVLQRATCPRCGYSFHVATARFCGGCGVALGATCASCGLIQPADRTRCAQCDQPLPHTCGECGSLNLPSAKFCANCSALIVEGQASLIALRGQRRRVSVLFADIQGFTNLANQLDSEQVYLMVDGLLRLLAEEVQRFGGVIDKFTGDGLMATFGAVRALEQHAAQAISAAMAMQEVTRNYSDTMEARYGGRLHLRTGISSGEVVAGELGSSKTRDYTVLGDTVNLANRLESAATPGTVLVSQATYEQTSHQYVFTTRSALELKGYREPITGYEVVGARQNDIRVPWSDDLVISPFEGRQEELATLQGLTMGLQRGQGAAVLIVADTGFGKTRLVQEFIHDLLNQRIKIVEAHAQLHNQTIPYGTLQELVWSLLGLSGQGGGPVVAEMVSRRLAKLQVDEIEDTTAALQHLLGLGPYDQNLRQRIEHLEPSQRKLQIKLAVTALMSRVGNNPMIVFIDDFHWVDQLSRDMLTSMAPLLAGHPVMLVITSRPMNLTVLDEFGTSLVRAGVPLLDLRLDPLTEAEMQTLVSKLDTENILPPALVASLCKRAEGNPLFLQELVRLVLTAHTNLTSSDDAEAIDAVPQSVQEIILARYDQLSSRARRVIAQAAVIGRELPAELLLELLPGSSAGRWAEQIQELVDLNMLVANPNQPGILRFAHALIYETIYQSLLQSDRETIHDRIAEVLLERANPDEWAELISYHLLRGGESVRAVPWLYVAGQKAAQQFANDTAMEAFNEALEQIRLYDPEHALRIKILIAAGDVLVFTGAFDQARELFTQALAMAMPRTEQEVELQRRIGACFVQRGLLQEAEGHLMPAMELARELGESTRLEQARIANEIGWRGFRLGQWTDARHWLEHGLELLEGSDHLSDQAAIFNRLGGVCWMEGDMDAAIRYTRRALEVREQMNATDAIARSSANLGVLAVTRGDWDEALAHYARVQEIQRRIGDREGLSVVLSNMEELLHYRGEMQQAAKLLTDIEVVVNYLKTAKSQAMYQRSLAHKAFFERDWHGLQQLALRNLRHGKRDSAESIFHLTMLSRSSLATGHLARALRSARLAAKLARKLRTQKPQTLRAYAEALIVAGKHKRASTVAEESLAEAGTGLSRPIDEAQSYMLLAQISADKQQAAQLKRDVAKRLKQVKVKQEALTLPQHPSLRLRRLLRARQRAPRRTD